MTPVGIVLFSPSMAELLSEIETFLARTGMTPTAFGRAALNDGMLIPNLKKKGRRLWPETEAKVRDFMREKEPTQQ